MEKLECEWNTEVNMQWNFADMCAKCDHCLYHTEGLELDFDHLKDIVGFNHYYTEEDRYRTS